MYSRVRNSSTVLKQENIVCSQVEKDINTGVFILRTVDFNIVKKVLVTYVYFGIGDCVFARVIFTVICTSTLPNILTGIRNVTK